MTLRGRLTSAFLSVVLGPVLLGAVFVGGAVDALGRDRAQERLDLAAEAVRGAVGGLCGRLSASADALAVLPDPAQRAGLAARVVSRGLASAVQVVDGTGAPQLTTANLPASPWADCAAPGSAEAPPRAIAARVEIRDAFGLRVAVVYVVQAVDEGLVRRLSAATGGGVTLIEDPDGTAARGAAEPADRAGLAWLTGGGSAADGDGRYVRRLGPAPGQPLPLAVSVPGPDRRDLFAVLLGIVVLAGALAVLVAAALARSTTRPLAELVRAADRVAGGDLDARVPVRGHDEVARLGGAFNRMTRETQAYVQALTAGRDQLRRHLRTLGETLSGTHDLDRILRVLLRTAMVATGARAGLVLLHDPETGHLVGRCADGLGDRTPHAEPAALRIAVGRGLLGSVAATAEPRRGRVHPDGAPLCPEEPRCRTYVAVPFRPPYDDAAGEAGPAASGVLALYDRLGADDFDDVDLGTLRTFAGQAAVAVENVRVHEEAQRLSLTDPVTGLWNYRYLQESIRREVERASRFGRTLAVLVLDLDHFKAVNDTYGHAVGDAVLVEFARRVRSGLREVDLAFRQGGEEFVVLLPETDSDGAATVAERLGAAVRDSPVAVSERLRVPVTVSIGIAVYPRHGGHAQRVLDAADEAVYAAKAAGRDTYRISAPPPAARAPRAGVSSATIPAVPLLALDFDRESELDVRLNPVSVAGEADGADDEGAAATPSGVPSGPQTPRQSRGR
ncbi:GGDEF domain-containing protein [Catenuloplanes atrovinosus]|uniref:Diguanylate cyclase (GGDEF)-like protein n=1 Tax=Catenuloplanes atrovinosus TaxID=137266 RepID=A0AAE4CDN6_9ACTN|nr:diguanylate cyclase [Catenuloplanes atrovinosus]MDR7280617.1 diguanylate cyclase (GGDEF)-like protein [Catenuloplanes atrovinosus]